MTKIQLLFLATAVTMGGILTVIWAARLINRHMPSRGKQLAAFFIFVYMVVVLTQPPVWQLNDLAVLVGTIGLAVLFRDALNRYAAVVAFLLGAAIVDIVSFSGGFTRSIIERYQAGTSDLLLYLTLVVPIDGELVPIVGISELFIGGSAAVALIHLGIKPILVIGAISLGILGALIFGIWQGGVAALPFMAVAVIFLIWWNSARSSRDAENEISQ